MTSSRASGFTLIEVIVAMAIMAFLSIFTVQSIQRALNTKSKVQKDIDRNATVRDALRIMERDINMAFNYRDPYIELYNKAQDARSKGGTGTGTTSGSQLTPQQQQQQLLQQQQQANADPEKYKKKTPKQVSQFIGDTQSLDFTSLSNIRMMEESKMSQQAEVGYSLKACRRRSNQEQSSNCLWRRISNYIHDDITKEGQQTVILENVEEFKLRYLGPGKDDEWVDTWMTNERGDDTTKNKFPYAVEITIAVKDNAAKDKTFRLTTVAAIRNPNNPADPNDPNNPNKDGQNANNPLGGGQIPPKTPGTN